MEEGMTLREASATIRAQIGKAARTERERRGWSLLQVSRETGGLVPRYAVDRIENGELRDVTAIALVLAALGFELAECMMYRDSVLPSPATQPFGHYQERK